MRIILKLMYEEQWGVFWFELDSWPLKAVQTLCFFGCKGNVATGISKANCTLNVVRYGGNILQ